jgi:hypothetical protein
MEPADPNPPSSAEARSGSESSSTRNSRPTIRAQGPYQYDIGTGQYVESGAPVTGAGPCPCDPYVCDECGPGFALLAGAGFRFVKPHWEHTPGFATLSSHATFSATADATDVVFPFVLFNSITVATTGVTAAGTQDLDFDYAFSPYAWVGLVGCTGTGIRGRYWLYDQNTHDSFGLSTGSSVTSTSGVNLIHIPLVNFDNFGTTSTTAGVAVSADLKLDVWDLELTQNLCVGDWSFLFALGGRYAHVSQNYSAFLLEQSRVTATANTSVLGGFLGTTTDTAVVDGTALAAVKASNQFIGAGPTLGLEARYQLGGGFALYGSARGSVLFGDTEQKLTRIAGDNSSGTFLTSGSTSTITDSETIPVAEWELGVEWGRAFGATRFFVQAAWVGQVYFDLGSATEDESDLTFTGFSVAAGLQF